MKKKGPGKTIGLFLLSLIVLLAVWAGSYAFLVHPWLIKWGATDAEFKATLPGDDVVSAPDFSVTHAVNVRAAASEVWKWVIQLGQGRGGFYSYDGVENLLGLDIHSVDRIVPELQNLKVGERISIGTEKNDLLVVAIESGRTMILKWKLGEMTWSFVIETAGGNSSRFFVRTRGKNDPGFFDRAMMSVIEPVSFIMERKMMLGIKARAEKAAGIPAPNLFSERIWFYGLVASALGLIAVLLTRKPWLVKIFFASAGVVPWVLVLFRGYPSPVLSGILTMGVLSIFIWSARK